MAISIGVVYEDELRHVWVITRVSRSYSHDQVIVRWPFLLAVIEEKGKENHCNMKISDNNLECKFIFSTRGTKVSMVTLLLLHKKKKEF